MMVSIAALCLECSLISYSEMREKGTILQVGSVVCWPIALCCLMLASVGRLLGFYQLEDYTIRVLSLGFFALFISEHLVYKLLKKNNMLNRSGLRDQITLVQPMANERIVFQIVLVCVLIGYVRLAYLLSLHGVGYYFASDGLGGMMMTGPVAHIILLGFCLCPTLFLRAVDRKDVKAGVLWLLYLLLLFSTCVKYHSIVFVLISVIFALHVAPSKMRVVIPIIMVCPILLFLATYVLNFISRGSSISLQYLFQHLVHYLCGGVLYPGLASTDFSEVYSPLSVFISQFAAPFNQVVKHFHLTGWEMPVLEMLRTGIHGETANVCNLVSLFFIKGSLFGGFLALSLFGIILSLVINLSSNALLKSALLGILLLSFFGDYFTLFLVWEIILISAVVPLLINKTVTLNRLH